MFNIFLDFVINFFNSLLNAFDIPFMNFPSLKIALLSWIVICFIISVIISTFRKGD